jgi:hypothetical protein
MNNKYLIEKRKIDNLMKRTNQIKHKVSYPNTQNEITFYPRVINNTGIHSTDEEVEFLSKRFALKSFLFPMTLQPILDLCPHLY